MIASHYVTMLQGKSVIRELSEFATARGKEIGYENVFDFSLGNPSVAVPEEVTRTMIRLLQEKDPMELHGYSPSLGIGSVREAVAESLRERFGIPYQAEDIFMTSGAAGAIAHAVRAVTEPGDEVITFAPCFSEYIPYINGTGAKLKMVPADTETFQIHFDAFEEMLSEKTAAVLINTPNNPSGIVYSRETLQRLAEILLRKAEDIRPLNAHDPACDGFYIHYFFKYTDRLVCPGPFRFISVCSRGCCLIYSLMLSPIPVRLRSYRFIYP